MTNRLGVVLALGFLFAGGKIIKAEVANLHSHPAPIAGFFYGWNKPVFHSDSAT
jgi:hypothetical protein